MKIRRRSDPESGVILLLTLFVILITYALVAQLTIGTSVAYQVSKNAADRIRMTRAATDVAADEVLRALGDDLPEAAADEAAPGEGDVPGGLGDGPGIGDDGEGEAEEEEDDGSNSDSFNDDWSRSARITLGEMEVFSFVQDENSKFNILSCFVQDELERELARERFVRILDFMREDFDDDLDSREAEQILEEFIGWVEGENRDLDMPIANRHSASLLGELAAQQTLDNDSPAPVGDDDEGSATLPIEELYLPFSLEELLLLEHVTENLFYDQLRINDEIAPGIETVFTIYTAIDFNPPSNEELGESGPDDGAAAEGLDDIPTDEGSDIDGSEADEEDDLADATGGLDDVLEAGPAFGVKMNINTMPVPVLKGLMTEEEFPSFFVNAILEYRNEVDEEARRDQQAEDVEYDERELRRSLYREDEPVPMQYFRNLEDLANIDGWEERLSDEQRAAFQELIGVQSDIFSVYLWCRVPAEDWEQKNHYEESPGPIMRLKAVVWRRPGEDGAKFVFIEPWHEVMRTRWRIPDFQDRLLPYLEPEW